LNGEEVSPLRRTVIGRSLTEWPHVFHLGIGAVDAGEPVADAAKEATADTSRRATEL